MKNTLILSTLIFLTSCGVTLKSVVDTSLTQKYKNPLLVIPYERQTLNFSKNLKRNLEETFSENQQKAEVLLVQIADDEELTLNENNSAEMKINSAILKDGKDLVIVFKPVRLQYYNGGLQTASYQLIGTDIKTKREVWKANFSSSGSFGPSTFAKASATKIYAQLKSDGVLP